MYLVGSGWTCQSEGELWLPSAETQYCDLSLAVMSAEGPSWWVHERWEWVCQKWEAKRSDLREEEIIKNLKFKNKKKKISSNSIGRWNRVFVRNGRNWLEFPKHFGMAWYSGWYGIEGCYVLVYVPVWHANYYWLPACPWLVGWKILILYWGHGGDMTATTHTKKRFFSPLFSLFLF